MLLALSSKISEIDKLAAEKWGIPLTTLMERSGKVVADAVRSRVGAGGRVVILAGKGNNGGDGYAAACLLFGEYDTLVFDIFGAGQKTAEGKHFLEKYREMGGRVEKFEQNDTNKALVKGADCIVDAIFGTGFCGSMPDDLATVSTWINETTSAVKIAIDVPIGVNADTGSVNTTYACNMHATVILSFVKPGLVSYPARSFVGDVIFSDIGLPIDKISGEFEFRYSYIDADSACGYLPKRDSNSNKGSFGRLLVITGSSKYKGAAHLSLEAALRGGAGYVTYMGEGGVADELRQKFPEAIYRTVREIDDSITEDEIKEICEASEKSSATLIGSGSCDTDGLYRLTLALLGSEGGALILDADAINALARHRENAISAIKSSPRSVILTPHPLEFSRLSGDSVSDVQLHRIESAMKFSAENRCTLVLKGAGTVVTDGRYVRINSSGSSALAKAGSGDVLAGLLASLVASGADVLDGSCAAVYFHGSAADKLARELSAFGVIPSDLPRKIAMEIADTV